MITCIKFIAGRSKYGIIRTMVYYFTKKSISEGVYVS